MAIRKEATIEQYTGVVGLLDQMFKEMDIRSNVATWRWEGSPYFMIGSCTIDKETSEGGIYGPARELIIQLRETRREENPGFSNLSPCPYHRENFGCVLGDQKSPLCIEHIDYPSELEKRFGIDGYKLEHDIRWILDNIQNDLFPKKLTDSLGVSVDDGSFAKLASEAIVQMTNRIRRYPILHTEETPFVSDKELGFKYT